MHNILMIDTGKINKGVFRSHVMNLIYRLEKIGVYTTLISIHGINSSNEDSIQQIQKELGKNNFFCTNSDIFFPQLYYRILKKIKINKISFLYCQNYLPSFFGLALKCFNKKLHVHADIKGIVPEEHLLYDTGMKKYVIYLLAKIMEFFIFRYADSFSVVSNEFKKYFENKYSLKDKQILILPSSFDKNNFYFDNSIRDTIRNQEGWQEKIVVIYSGSMVTWQLPERLIGLMQDLSNQNSQIVTIILTLDTKKAQEIKKSLNFEKLIIRSCNGNQEVNKYLNASDVALILRKRDIVNQVSSPTKIAEYLTTKNKLILSEGIGDYSSFASKYGGVFKIDDIERIDIKQIGDFIQYATFDEKLKEIIDTQYTLQSNIAKINTLFSKQ